MATQSASTTSRRRASTLPARYRDYAVRAEDFDDRQSGYATWSEGSTGRKRGRADKNLMSLKELQAAFTEERPTAKETSTVDADAFADVLFGAAAAPAAGDWSGPKKQVRRSPPSTPTEEVETLAMLEALVAKEDNGLLAPPTSFHNSPRSSSDDEDDADDAFTDEVSSLFQLMGAAEDTTQSPFELLAAPDMLFGVGMTGLGEPPLDMPPLPPFGLAAAPASLVLDPNALALDVMDADAMSSVSTEKGEGSGISSASDKVTASEKAAAAAISDKGVVRNIAERKEWSAAEDELIRTSVESNGCKWRLIAAQLPGRSDDAVRNRWNRLKGAQNPKPAAEPNGELAAEGSSKGGRGGSKPRSSSHADGEGGSKPERVSWSREEDETIVQSVSEFGHKWGKIAQRLPGRTEHAIRNRYSRLQTLFEESDKRTEMPSFLPIPIAAF